MEKALQATGKVTIAYAGNLIVVRKCMEVMGQWLQEKCDKEPCGGSLVAKHLAEEFKKQSLELNSNIYLANLEAIVATSFNNEWKLFRVISDGINIYIQFFLNYFKFILIICQGEERSYFESEI